MVAGLLGLALPMGTSGVAGAGSLVMIGALALLARHSWGWLVSTPAQLAVLGGVAAGVGEGRVALPAPVTALILLLLLGTTTHALRALPRLLEAPGLEASLRPLSRGKMLSAVVVLGAIALPLLG